MTTAVDIIKEARALIADKSRWTTGACARDAKGQPCFADDAQAVCWCGLGAMMRSSGVLTRTNGTDDYRVRGSAYDGAVRFVEESLRSEEQPGPAYVNDHLGHEAVLALFDRAIKRAVPGGPK